MGWKKKYRVQLNFLHSHSETGRNRRQVRLQAGFEFEFQAFLSKGVSFPEKPKKNQFFQRRTAGEEWE
jgi:hypothetical protein